jgi:hypothetical protein
LIIHAFYGTFEEVVAALYKCAKKFCEVEGLDWKIVVPGKITREQEERGEREVSAYDTKRLENGTLGAAVEKTSALLSEVGVFAFGRPRCV